MKKETTNGIKKKTTKKKTLNKIYLFRDKII